MAWDGTGIAYLEFWLEERRENGSHGWHSGGDYRDRSTVILGERDFL